MKKIIVFMQICTLLVSCTYDVPSIDIQDLSKQSINLSGIEKQKIKTMNNNPAWCDRTQKSEDCTCPPDYTKVNYYGTSQCVPHICTNVKGAVGMGDVLSSNIMLCFSAIQNKNLGSCGVISYQEGRDICTLAYVGATGNLTVCEKIENEELRSKCLG